MKQYGRVLRTIGGDQNAEWTFIDHDQDTIRLQLVRDRPRQQRGRDREAEGLGGLEVGSLKLKVVKDRYILVDKRALRLFANAFSELAQELSG